ncbi:MAG: helix-turn-helix domain-containing protein [Oceanospirillaceae bacterium]
MSSREFSSVVHATNRNDLGSDTSQEKSINIGFLLLEHFSMMSFTAALDALVTANLVQTCVHFNIHSYSLKGNNITSDLNIEIKNTRAVAEVIQNNTCDLDYLIVCGGLRCSLVPSSKLNYILQTAAKSNIVLGGIWNGVIAVAQAGLLSNQPCALHVDNHPFMQEYFPTVKISDCSFISSAHHLSCVDALGALDMMLNLVESLLDSAVTKAVKVILTCSKSRHKNPTKLIQLGDDEKFPQHLRSCIQLMNSNIDDPLAVEDIALYLKIHRRKIERSFKLYLNTTASRYYLEIRLTYARRLLTQTDDSITNISIASGFINSNHFSHCFSRYFEMSPSTYRKQKSHFK